MILRRFSILFLGGCLLLRAAELKPEDARESALSAWKAGKHQEAVALVSQAITANPKDARLLNMRAQMRLLLKDGKGALNDLDEAIRLEPELASLRQERAALLFKAGKLEAACADFDKANELAPRLVPQNWQRGIALYYAGRFADGRKQFEVHQTVNSEDVENAVWHFLCVVRAENLEAARKALIPIEKDGRVPMREVQRLFAGKGTVEDVFAAAKAGEPTPAELRDHEFYAHLYVGLYFEATGDVAKTREHILKAASLATPGNYMGDVARVHAVLLQLPKSESSSKQP
jgi:lipoprotein NlpI